MKTPILRSVCVLLSTLACGFTAAAQNAAAYDPLALPAAAPEPTTVDLTIHDSARDRDVPIRVYLPAQKQTAPVILFSHGLGGSRAGSVFLGRHWAARGYVAVFLQHPGSDESVWRGVPAVEALDAMRRAISLQNYELRVKDVPAVLDQLALWQKADGHPLAGRMDLAHVGMSGHSYGALTTQAVSGEHMVLGESPTDARIKAAIIMSPSPPIFGSAEEAFGGLKIPWMLMTGTKDQVPALSRTTPAARLAVYAALPPGGKYELVLDRAEHSVFVDHALPGDVEPRNPNHPRAILALSTAFWDAYLRGDEAARAWLDGDGARSVLEPADQWQRK